MDKLGGPVLCMGVATLHLGAPHGPMLHMGVGSCMEGLGWILIVLEYSNIHINDILHYTVSLYKGYIISQVESYYIQHLVFFYFVNLWEEEL